jgi:DNA-binding transcriptional ArsR family regulator
MIPWRPPTPKLPEWAAGRRGGKEWIERLALVSGPRRVGKSYLVDLLAEAAGGVRYQAITGLPAVQIADFGRALGGWLGVSRLKHLDKAFVAIDELPYLLETSPELPGLLQRYVDEGEGPPLILAGSALSVMSGLTDAKAPLFGRASVVVVPERFGGRDLARLWRLDDPAAALWVDAVLGGLPGYRPLVAAPKKNRDKWMTLEVLAPGSPLLDSAEAALATVSEPSPLRGVYRSILAAIASGERTFSAIARVAGLESGALSRPLAGLSDAGLVERIPDPLRSRRDATTSLTPTFASGST